MKKILSIFSVLALGCAAFAQEPAGSDSVAVEVAPEGYMYVDSVVYRQVPRCNEELEGMSIYEALGDVQVNESYAVRKAVAKRVAENKGPEGEVDGYRIRIYFDNKQKSREESQEVMKRFQALYPGYNTYLKFNNPNFKVTVGDFRTKVDAQIALQSIIRDFPTAFIVKEKMRFPVVSDKVRYYVDTVRVLRPIPGYNAVEQ